MKKVCIGILSFVIVACSTKSFAPNNQQLTAMQQKVPGIALESAIEGHRLYSEKCAGCHQLFNPGKYTIAQWDNILPKMFPKAKVLGEEQRKLIEDYVHALSK